MTAGYYCNADIAQIIKENFPEYANKLPEHLESDIPKDVWGIDNSRSKKVLGITYRPLKESVIDTVKSLQDVGV